ncbi:hypothetical protein [Maridesulfovibrio zosterae]|uniref:hypothetical protein n=1 Tax=Maridesulfovibrio zosterae TaxID=82171 RepID=UPI0004050322|nr:hypothetical protein [Maridesulfovibrio zosterae]
MTTLMMAITIFALAFAGLAIGIIFKRNCIRGSCQGSIQAGDGSGCRCGKYDFDKKKTDETHSPKPFL